MTTVRRWHWLSARSIVLLFTSSVFLTWNVTWSFNVPLCLPTHQNAQHRTIHGASSLERRRRPEKCRRLGRLSVMTDETSSSSSIATTTTPETDALVSPSQRALGVSVLFSVPVVWGTYAPVIRYVYEMERPIPGLVFSAAYYALAAVTLHALWRWSSSRNTTIATTSAFPVAGGFELGLYLFLGNCFQVVGLETVPVDRAAFLVQLTTIFVPLVQAFSTSWSSTNNVSFWRILPLQTWLACVLAFGGVIILGLDDTSTVADATAAAASSSVWETLGTTSFGGGDLLIVLAACSYTMHVVRLDKYAKETTPLQLAASKATVEAFLSTLLVGGLALLAPSSTLAAAGSSNIDGEVLKSLSLEIATFFQTTAASWSISSIPASAVFAVFWTGWVTCAYTIYAQSFGQARVQNPTNANLIYSTQPLFSAAFAYWLLGERLGPWGFTGAALILTSLGLINIGDSSSGDSDEKDVTTEQSLLEEM